jgi:hypothetical protein
MYKGRKGRNILKRKKRSNEEANNRKTKAKNQGWKRKLLVFPLGVELVCLHTNVILISS